MFSTVYRSVSLYSHPRLRSVFVVAFGSHTPKTSLTRSRARRVHTRAKGRCPLVQQVRVAGGRRLEDFSLSGLVLPSPFFPHGSVPAWLRNLQDFCPKNGMRGRACQAGLRRLRPDQTPSPCFSHTGLTGIAHAIPHILANCSPMAALG